VDETLTNLAGGLKSGMGYLCASDLASLKKRARYIRVSPAGQWEAATHDIVEIQTPKSSE